MDNTTTSESLQVYKEREVSYKSGDRIGKGNCVVYKCRKRYHNKRIFGLDDMRCWPYALKSVELDDDLDKAKLMFEEEVKILRQAQHHHVIEYIDAYAVKGNKNPRLELIMGRGETDLSKILASKSLESEDLDHLRQWFTCLLCAVDHIHGLGIRHRDIKPANIIIKTGKVLLADFGISKMGLGKTLSTTVPGWARGRSEPYCAPEVADGGTRGRSADIFSLGAVFFEMLLTHSYRKQRDELATILQYSDSETRSFAKRLQNVHEFMNRLERDIRAHGWQHEILSICRDMMQRNRADRPHAFELWNRLPSLSDGNDPPSCNCMKSVYMTEESKLIDACKNGSLEKVENLVCINGAKPNTIGAIHQAARRDSPDIVQFLLDRGVDVNLPDCSGQTALHCAAGYGQKGVVNLLLQRGAKVSFSDIDGRTALHHAAGGGHTKILELLLDTIERRDGTTELAKDSDGQTALHFAAKRGHKESVGLLLRRKPQAVNEKDRNGRTALHFAAGYGCPEVVSLLLEYKADCKTCDRYDWTALHFVVHGFIAKPMAEAYNEVAEILIKGGADAEKRDDNNFSPYYHVRDTESTLRKTLQKAMNSPRKGV